MENILATFTNTDDGLEEWRKTRVGRRSVYEVSNLGNVRRADGKPMAVFQNKVNGYWYVGLSMGQFRVHRLVMEAFVGLRPHDMVTNHKNGDKGDNRLENLEYCTQQENIDHAIEILGFVPGKPQKLTAEDVAVIRNHRGRGLAALARSLGVSYTTIKVVRRGDSWKRVLHGA